MRVLHVIADLGQGGAEMVLCRLAARTAGRIEHLVVSLRSHGDVGPILEASGVRVEALGLPRGAFTPAAMRRIVALIREYRPDLVQGRLHHGNFIGGLAARRVGVPVAWAVHATDLGKVRDNWRTVLVRQACALLSHAVPKAIVFDAERSRRLHVRLGYSRARSRVIDNGIELDRFRPDAVARVRQRRDWGIADDDVLIGCVARWDPLKDHGNLIAAVARVAQARPRVRCVLVGRSMNADNGVLAELIDRHAVRDRVLLVGRVPDLPAAMNALDLHVLASRSESAPVCAVEAMACGTPCVVTDVGDSARLVGDSGWVAAPRSPGALAAAIDAGISALETEGPGVLEARCRARAERFFGVDTMVDRYVELWQRLAR